MTSHLRTLANAHWLAAHRKLIADYGGEWRDFGAVRAYLGGLPLSFANGILVLEPALIADLDAAIEWLAAADVPYRIRIDDSLGEALLDVAPRHGLVRDPLLMPGMVMTTIRDAPQPPPGVTTARVDAAQYAEFEQLIIDTGTPAPWARPAFPPSLLDDPDTALFIGRLDGQPAATSLLVRTGGDAGIYAVGTVEAARRRGVGTAVTWAAVEVAREWGCDAVVLQASPMGFSIYRAMGFESVVSYARLMPPAVAEVRRPSSRPPRGP